MAVYAGHFTDAPRTRTGRPIPNALVALRVPGSATSPTFYTNRAKTSTVAAADIKTDSRGNLDIYVEPGIYEYWFDGALIQTVTVDEDNAEDDATNTSAISAALASFALGYYTKAEVTALLSSVTNATLLSGPAAPTNDIGTQGSWYIERTNLRLYGPKGATQWPSSYTSMRGEPGAKGDPGVSPFEFRGVWDGDETYDPNDQVAFEGLLYVALVTSTDVEPDSDEDVWAQATQAGPAGASGALPLSQQLAMWTASGAYQMLGPSYHGTYQDVIAESEVIWPDDSEGTYAATSIDYDWGTVKSYTVTHDLSGSVITQPAITRDSMGRRTTTPALMITGAGDEDAYLNEYTGGY